MAGLACKRYQSERVGRQSVLPSPYRRWSLGRASAEVRRGLVARVAPAQREGRALCGALCSCIVPYGARTVCEGYRR